MTLPSRQRISAGGLDRNVAHLASCEGTAAEKGKEKVQKKEHAKAIAAPEKKKDCSAFAQAFWKRLARCTSCFPARSGRVAKC